LKIGKLVANNLKQLRENKGLTLEELGSKIGVSRQAIWNMENDTSWITKDKAAKLSKALGVEEHVIFQIDTSKIK